MKLQPLCLLALTVGALFCAPLACAQWGGGAPSGEPMHRHEVVQVTNMILEPKVVELPADGTVAWTNMSIYAATVSFDANVADAFTCKELSPVWNVVEGRLVSIQVGEDMEDVAMPCPLRPGSYDYEVGLTQRGPFAGDQLGEDPLRSLRGRIVVK